MAKTKAPNYEGMNDDELTLVRAAIDEQYQALRVQKKELAISIEPTHRTKPTAEMVADVNAQIEDIESQMLELRAEKKKIQDVIDSRIQPLSDADHTLSLGGVEGGEAFGKL